MEMSGQIHAPDALPPGLELLVPVDRRLAPWRSTRGMEVQLHSF